MAPTTYYSISLFFPEGIPGKIQYQQNDLELFLSANGKLTATAMAHLRSRELAERFLAAYLPRLQKRYKDGFEAKVGEWLSVRDNKRLSARIEKDSSLVEKRLETGVLASNVTP
ncbi:hypothetical protein [Geomonas subterranea]|uniref:hypothetical protein n=1 Tax=Geomonas subterranea TaxID=2847989 RepID=UPI001CD5DFCC|nr:hypothetical protein [Geomonas fuzhouensis]